MIDRIINKCVDYFEKHDRQAIAFFVLLSALAALFYCAYIACFVLPNLRKDLQGLSESPVYLSCPQSYSNRNFGVDLQFPKSFMKLSNTLVTSEEDEESYAYFKIDANARTWGVKIEVIKDALAGFSDTELACAMESISELVDSRMDRSESTLIEFEGREYFRDCREAEVGDRYYLRYFTRNREDAVFYSFYFRDKDGELKDWMEEAVQTCLVHCIQLL